MGQQIIFKKANFKENAIYRERLQVFDSTSDATDLRSSSSNAVFSQGRSLFSALQSKEIIGIRQIVKKHTSVKDSPMYYWDIEVNQDNNLAEITTQTKNQTVFKSKKLLFSRTTEEVAELYNNSEDGEVITTFFDEPIIFNGNHLLGTNVCGIFGWFASGDDNKKGMVAINTLDSLTVDEPVISAVFSTNILAIDFIYNNVV